MAQKPRWIAAELVRLLFRHAPAVLAANVANASLMLAALWPVADRAVLVGWFAAVCAVSLCRLDLWWCSRRALSEANCTRWGGWYTVGSTVSGLLWGCTAWMFISPGNPETLLLVSFVIGGMGAGAVASLSPYPPAFYLYVIGSIVLFELRLFALGDRISLVMAGMATVYVIGLVVIGRNLHAVLVRALELNQENRHLLVNREREVRLRTADLRVANAELEREINERKAVELRLEEAREEADRANEAKSRFLAAASHDLRQPLQSLYLFTSVLHRHVGGDRKGLDALVRIERGLDILKGLLDGLLDLTRLDVNIIHPNWVAFPLKPMLDDIVAAYARVAASKGIVLTGGPLADTLVFSDQVLLGRMIRNLVENALRYTEHGSIRLSCEVAGGIARIDVSDTGIGIPQDQLERIFEEFHQIGNPERDKARGLGLGLAIVQRLSRILDHPVEVRSQLGVGTTFSVRLPTALNAPCHPVAEEEEERLEDFGTGHRVVVIDDDPMVLLALNSMLEQWGFDVTIAGCGDSALAQLHPLLPPQLIIADYRLRGGKVGTDAIRVLRDACSAEIPAVVLTGETGAECATAAQSLGALVLHKPVTPRDLATAMRRLETAG